MKMRDDFLEKLIALLEGVIISIRFPHASKQINIKLISSSVNNKADSEAVKNKIIKIQKVQNQETRDISQTFLMKRKKRCPVFFNEDDIAELENFIKNNPELTYKQLAEKRGIATYTLFKAIKKYNLPYQVKKRGKRRRKITVLMNVPNPSSPVVADTDIKKEAEEVEKKEEVKQSIKDDADKLIDEKTEQELAALIKRAVEMDNNFSTSYDDVMKFDNEFSKLRDKKIIIKSSSLGSWILRTFNGRTIEFNKLSVFNSYHVFPFKEIGRTIMIFEDRYNGNAVRFSVWWKANREIVANWELRTNNLVAALAYDRTRKKRE